LLLCITYLLASQQTDEGELTGFLGIDTKCLGNKFNISQPALIKKIVNLAGLQDCKSNKVPAMKVLGLLLENPAHSKDWEYASMIGMLMYLFCNSRPDNAFAVDQCTRFTHNPHHGHTQAVNQIVCYLCGIADEGLLFETTKWPMVDYMWMLTFVEVLTSMEMYKALPQCVHTLAL
jgi:hypothetical protein